MHQLILTLFLVSHFSSSSFSPGPSPLPVSIVLSLVSSSAHCWVFRVHFPLGLRFYLGQFFGSLFALDARTFTQSQSQISLEPSESDAGKWGGNTHPCRCQTQFKFELLFKRNTNIKMISIINESWRELAFEFSRHGARDR